MTTFARLTPDPSPAVAQPTDPSRSWTTYHLGVHIVELATPSAPCSAQHPALDGARLAQARASGRTPASSGVSNQLGILAGNAVIYEGWVDERGEYHRGLPGPGQQIDVRCGQTTQPTCAAEQLLTLNAAEIKKIRQLQPAPVLSRLMQAAQITTLRLSAEEERELWAVIDRAMDGHTAEDTALVARLLGTCTLEKIDTVLGDMKAPF